MKELLKQLKIDIPGYFTDNNTYVIDLEDSDEFSNIFSKLDKSDGDLIEENADVSITNVDVSNVMYYSDSYILNLIADYNSDNYKLVISPR